MFDLLLKKLIAAIGFPGDIVELILRVWAEVLPAIESEARREAEIALFVADIRAGQIPHVVSFILGQENVDKAIEDLIVNLGSVSVWAG